MIKFRSIIGGRISYSRSYREAEIVRPSGSDRTKATALIKIRIGAQRRGGMMSSQTISKVKGLKAKEL